MSDLISRQAAIEALERTKEKDPKGDIACFYNTITDNKIAVIESLPPAQPGHGRWIKMNGDRGYECSECGWESDTTWDYCPSCGARMDQEADHDDHL